MVRKISSLMAILALGFIASMASATNMNSSSAGGPVAIAVNTTLIPGGTNVTFQPSSQVNIRGTSVRTSFAAISGHEAVKGKAAGQNYGMAADSSNVFWQAAPDTFPSTYANTNSGGFQSGWNRN